MDLYIDTEDRVAVRNAWDKTRVESLTLRSGDKPTLNLYFLDRSIDRRAPFAIHRYAGATISAQLLDDTNTAQATQASWTEIVPAWGQTPTAAVTITIASPGVVSWTAHGFANGQAVVFGTTGALPTGLAAGTTYFVVNKATNTFQVALTPGGAAINTSGAQNGTHSGFALSSVTRIVSGTAAVGEYDRIQLAAPPASGSLNLVLQGGTVVNKGATSASARIYPGVSSLAEAAASLAPMNGSPWVVQLVSPTIIDVHGNAAVTGTTPYVQSVDVVDLAFLFGWTAALDLTGANAGVAPLAAFDGETDSYVSLAIILTPSGGVASTVLKLPIHLFT